MRLLPFPPEFNKLRNLASKVAPFPADKKQIRVGIMGDSSTQFLHQAIKNTALLIGLNLHCFESDFDQIERQAMDPGSDLYRFDPHYIVLAWTAHACRQKFYKLDPPQQTTWHVDFAVRVRQVCAAIQTHSKAKILLFNLEEVDDAVFGNFAARTPQSFLYQTRKFNAEWMQICVEVPSIFPIDISALRARVGGAAFEPSIYVSTELTHSLDFTALMAKSVVDVVGSLEGRFHKCLILDLDNTLWGGIIGDDGVERIEIGGSGVGKAFKELQAWIKQMQRRGIILAVCSKNTEEIAKQPFLQHPDMELRLEDIAVFVANWENKADNIRYIQEILNLGFDSMVFLDDNPVERQLILEQLPEVAVPDLPEDPAYYLSYLQMLGLFETTSISETDAERTRQYQQEAERRKQSQSFTNLDDFLRSLEMKAFTRPFRTFDIPRVAQLSQRSNQFNLRTVRYSEADIEQLAHSDRHLTLAFDLKDKFGSHGLIGVVILEKRDNGELFIDTWFMSCRVLKRGMEDYILDQIVDAAQSSGFKRIIGEYIPTAKNGMVKDHYTGLGFKADGEKWVLSVDAYQKPYLFIEKSEQEI